MDGARLQALQYKGFSKSAKQLGLPYDVYRPSSAANPIADGNKVLTGFKAFFTPHSAPNFAFGKPMDAREPLCHIGCDAAQIQVGDIFVGSQGPYVVLSMDHIMPPLGVQALRTITISREEKADACGKVGYGGSTSTENAAMLSNWPASCIEGGRGKSGTLPTDPGPSSGWEFMFAPWGDLIVSFGDSITDDLGRRYGVKSAELTHTGWRVIAPEMVI